MSANFMQRDVRGRRCFVAMCLAWSFHGRANPQEVPAIKVELRVMAQPLDEALQEFARQSGVQVIYFSRLTKGIQSPGVHGRFTVPEALEALLKGSGLSFRMLNARAVAISKPESGALRQ